MAKSFKSYVQNLGRITIPKEVRDELDIKTGDYVEVEGLKKLMLVEEKEANQS